MQEQRTAVQLCPDEGARNLADRLKWEPPWRWGTEVTFPPPQAHGKLRNMPRQEAKPLRVGHLREKGNCPQLGRQEWFGEELRSYGAGLGRSFPRHVRGSGAFRGSDNLRHLLSATSWAASDGGGPPSACGCTATSPSLFLPIFVSAPTRFRARSSPGIHTSVEVHPSDIGKKRRCSKSPFMAGATLMGVYLGD